jgi:hypothetical protein
VGGKQGILVRISIVQLDPIELLYVNAHALHKVKITKQNSKEGYAIGACLAQEMES